MNKRLFSEGARRAIAGLNRAGMLAMVGALALLASQSATVSAQPGVETATATGTAISAPAPISQEALDSLLAPIALYPDALLAQILMASTFPMDVIEASRWQQQHPGTSGQALQAALEAYDWDPSVKSLVAVPQVLQYMNNAPRWMQDLGNAVVADQPRVMAEVQVLRRKAQEAGKLASNDKQVVKVANEPETKTEYITIAPATTQVVYVPVYDPYVVYGRWGWPTPPVYWGPPAGVAFTVGFYWWPAFYPSVSLWGGFNWGGGIITINAPVYSSYYHAPPPAVVAGPGNWWRWRPAPVYAAPAGPYYGRQYHAPYDRYRPTPAPPPAYAPGPWGRPDVNRPPRDAGRPPQGGGKFPNGFAPQHPEGNQGGRPPHGGGNAAQFTGNTPRPEGGQSGTRPPQGAQGGAQGGGQGSQQGGGKIPQTGSNAAPRPNEGARMNNRPAAERGNGNEGGGGLRMDGGFGHQGGRP